MEWQRRARKVPVPDENASLETRGEGRRMTRNHLAHSAQRVFQNWRVVFYTTVTQLVYVCEVGSRDHVR